MSLSKVRGRILKVFGDQKLPSEDLSRKGFRLVNGVWVSDALLFYLTRNEPRKRG